MSSAADRIGKSVNVIARAFDVLALTTAAFALVLSPLRDIAERTTLIANAVLILGLVGARHLLNRALAARPVHAVSMLLCFATIQPIALIYACAIEGDVVYNTGQGIFSHHDHTVRVAGATFVMFAAATFAALLIGQVARKPRPDWEEFLGEIRSADLRVYQWIGAFLLLAQLALLFGNGPETVTVNRTFGVIYIVQVGIGALWGSALFVGVGLRRQLIDARLLLASMVGGSIIMVVGGNRSTPILSMLTVSLGYVLTRPLERRRIAALGAGLAAVVMVVLVAGDVLRSDGAGRSGDVALRRMEQLASGDSHTEVDAETVRVTTLHRVLRNSSHTTISHVPEIIPFEPEGLERLPREFADTFVPGTLRDASWRPMLRAEFLRELGYIIDETTAVEFACLGDAWYRGGWLGVFVVGLVFGVALQLAELYTYYGKPHEQALKLVTLVAAAFQMEGRDIVFGVRRLFLMFAVATTVILLLKLRARAADPQQARVVSPG